MAESLTKEVIGVHFWVLALTAVFFLWLGGGLHAIGRFVLVVLLIVLLVSIAMRIYRYVINTKSIRYLKKAPAAGHKTLNAYVKVQGHLVATAMLQSPYTKEACAAFTYLVFGARKVKKKKPGKGLETVENKLHTQHSLSPLIIDNGSDRITLDLTDLMESGLSWVDKTFMKKLDVNRISGIEHQAKYESYRVVEKQFQNGDQVTVFGMLEEDNGQLVLRSSKSQKHPIILSQGTPEMLYSKFMNKYGEGGLVSIYVRFAYLLGAVILWKLFVASA